MTEEAQYHSHRKHSTTPGIEIEQHSALSTWPVELVLLRGQDDKYKINYTPEKLEPKYSLFWALARDLSVTFSGTRVKLRRNTVVASLITGSVADAIGNPEDNIVKHSLLVRFDHIPYDGILASEENLLDGSGSSQDSRLSILLNVFVSFATPKQNPTAPGDTGPADEVYPGWPPLAIPIDKWHSQTDSHDPMLKELFSTRYSSWSDRVALVVGTSGPLAHYNIGSVAEMPDEDRKEFALDLLGGGHRSHVMRLPEQH